MAIFKVARKALHWGVKRFRHVRWPSRGQWTIIPRGFSHINPGPGDQRPGGDSAIAILRWDPNRPVSMIKGRATPQGPSNSGPESNGNRNIWGWELEMTEVWQHPSAPSRPRRENHNPDGDRTPSSLNHFSCGTKKAQTPSALLSCLLRWVPRSQGRPQHRMPLPLLQADDRALCGARDP